MISRRYLVLLLSACATHNALAWYRPPPQQHIGVDEQSMQPAQAHTVVWVHDGRNLPEHRSRGQSAAASDLKAGSLKFYLPVCTFPVPEDGHIRAYEIRKALYRASGITAMDDLCNDVIPNASQQEAYVSAYNAVMNAAIVKKLGRHWKETIDQQVALQLRAHPKGKLQARDIVSDTPY